MKRTNAKKDIQVEETVLVRANDGNDPIDQANLDIHFIEAFVDLLWELSGAHNGELGTLKASTVSAMCYEARFKIDNVKKFIAAIPFKSIVFDTEGNIFTPPKRNIARS